jgi:hypothetical protein
MGVSDSIIIISETWESPGSELVWWSIHKVRSIRVKIKRHLRRDGAPGLSKPFSGHTLQ